MAISFDLSVFPVVVPYKPLPGEADHMARGRTVSEAVAAALKLPKGVALDDMENYANISCCSSGLDNPPVEFRLRVLGVANGQNAKKHLEYVGVSYVALDAAGKVVSFSGDLHAMEGGNAYWRAVNAGAEPPKPKKRPKDCGLLTFVSGPERTPMAITPELRALIEKVAPPADAKAEEKKPKKAAAKKK
jgi:hypothetical protein